MPMRNRSGNIMPMENINCVECGKSFWPAYRQEKLCSTACAFARRDRQSCESRARQREARLRRQRRAAKLRRMNGGCA